jgi:uncharacterized protein YecT (DUF1311 family)
MKLLSLVALLGGTLGQGALAQNGLDPEYQPLAAPLAEMVTDCLDQARDEEGSAACGAATRDECRMTGPGGDTTYGYVMCAILLGTLWDEELGRAWAAVQEGQGPEELERMRAEQAAWETYRQAPCDFEVARVAGGTMAQHVGGDCRVEMAAARVAEFREILRYR